MCDRCGPRIDRGIQALEAHANGEEAPPAPEEAPFPLVAFRLSDGKSVGILTNTAGWEAIKDFLATTGYYVDADGE